MSARERRGSDNLVATSASSSSAATALDEALLGSGGEGEGEAMFGGGGPDGPRTRVSFWLAVLSGLLGAFQFGYVHLIVHPRNLRLISYSLQPSGEGVVLMPSGRFACPRQRLK